MMNEYIYKWKLPYWMQKQSSRSACDWIRRTMSAPSNSEMRSHETVFNKSTKTRTKSYDCWPMFKKSSMGYYWFSCLISMQSLRATSGGKNVSKCGSKWKIDQKGSWIFKGML